MKDQLIRYIEQLEMEIIFYIEQIDIFTFIEKICFMHK